MIAGERRLEACKSLGWEKVPVTVVDIDEIVDGEMAENGQRKDFTPSEAVAIARTVEARERELARRRMTLGKLSPGSERGRTRDRIAACLGLSGKSLEHAQKVVAEAERDPGYTYLVEQMDEHGNVDRAYKQLKDDLRKAALHAPINAKIPRGLHVGPFQKLAKVIADSSTELVFCDPPWNEESIALYGDAAMKAARILKPGGSLIIYAGQMFLPDVLPLLTEHLKYYWTCVQVHDGGPYPRQPMKSHGIFNGCRLLLWLVKGQRGDKQTIIHDTIRTTREKDVHEWQQPLATAEHFIKHLTSPTGLVVDFFCGSGTTAVAAKKLGRPWVTFEIDKGTAKRAAARIEHEEEEIPRAVR